MRYATRRLLGLYYGLHHLVREMAKFGVVGAVAYVVDVGLFNLLLVGMDEGPLFSKSVSVAVATTVAYAGNRWWTFRNRSRSSLAREYVLFFVLNGAGLLIALACLWTSREVLGFTSPLADNIAANVVGLALGTTFRFWSYRRWVFRDVIGGDRAPAEPPAPDAGAAPQGLPEHGVPVSRPD